MTTTAEAIGLPFEEAIDFFRQKTRTPSSHWSDVWREAHSRSFMVAGAASEALLSDFQGAIKKALESGTTLAEFRRDFDAIVERHGWSYNGSPGWRSRVIYETNLSTAYSAGRYAQMTEPATLDAFPYWQYVHSGSRHPRLQHLAWNGLVLRADDPFWRSHYPPNGWRCGCRVRVISERGLARMGKSAPDPSPEIQMREWRNPKTGEVHQVPVGIDPGFDYNPGLAWKRGGKDIPVSSPPVKPVRQHVSPAVQTQDLRLTDAYKPWEATAGEDEKAALMDYKGTTGRPMNRVLRGELRSDALSAQADAVQGLLERAIAPEDMHLFRSVGPEELGALRETGAGGTFIQPGFTSTTLSHDVAQKYAKGGAIIRVRVRRGTEGVAYVQSVPKIRFDQYEVLIRHGARYKVVSIDGETIVIELERDHG